MSFGYRENLGKAVNLERPYGACDVSTIRFPGFRFAPPWAILGAPSGSTAIGYDSTNFSAAARSFSISCSLRASV